MRITIPACLRGHNNVRLALNYGQPQWATNPAGNPRVTRNAESANRTEVAYWKTETARARAHAAQVTQDKAAWAAGCQQGRDDVISVVPLIIAAQEQGHAPGNGSGPPPDARGSTASAPGADAAPAPASGSGAGDLAGRS